MVQLGETLCYKPEGCEFDSQLCYWNFSLSSSFRPHSGPWVNSTFNRNEYQGYLLGVKVASPRADNFTTFMC